jgi:c-di-GMP-binding flagellar brake protein YcgR
MATSRLISINPKEVHLGLSLPFALYDRTGKQLLPAGETITSQKQIDWLIETGLMASIEVAEQDPAIPTIDGAFTRLQLVPGIPMQIEQPGETPRRVACKLVGYDPAIGIFVSVHRKTIPFGDSEPIGVRLAHNNLIVLFQSKVIRPALPGMPVLTLEFPGEIKVQKFRRYTRTEISLQAQITNHSLATTDATDCEIVDISAGGARLSAPINSAKETHVIDIDFQLPGEGTKTNFKLAATVLSAKPNEKGKLEIKCEFIEIDPTDRILIEHFVLTEMSTPKRVSAAG